MYERLCVVILIEHNRFDLPLHGGRHFAKTRKHLYSYFSLLLFVQICKVLSHKGFKSFCYFNNWY